MIGRNEGALRESSHADWEGPVRLPGVGDSEVRPEGWVRDSQSKMGGGERGRAKGGKSKMIMDLESRKYYPGILLDQHKKLP